MPTTTANSIRLKKTTQVAEKDSGNYY